MIRGRIISTVRVLYCRRYSTMVVGCAQRYAYGPANMPCRSVVLSMSAYPFVCLSARMCQKPHDRTSTNYLHVTVAMVRS